MEVRTDNLVFSVSIEYLPHLIMGFLLLGAAGYCRGVWIGGWTNWTDLFAQIDPSLEADASPFDQTAAGCGGLVAAIFCLIFTIIFTILGFDQLLFSGLLWDFILGWGNSLL